MSTQRNKLHDYENTLPSHSSLRRDKIFSSATSHKTRAGPRSASCHGKRILALRPSDGEEKPKKKRLRIESDDDDIISAPSSIRPAEWPMIAFRFESRIVLLKRRSDYIETMLSVEREFGIKSKHIRLHTKISDFGVEPLEISAEVWPDLAGHLRTVSVVRKSGARTSISNAEEGKIRCPHIQLG
ncbi:hypothetical protein RhiJN_24135 [Ceratobasidium sp. AG-Ba]|nr:hypothetical protein RhiJN_24135 [Ceratobasidium sp. AG-Ba]